MKREHFLITSTEGHNVTKYAWNSARKEVQSIMQEYFLFHYENCLTL